MLYVHSPCSTFILFIFCSFRTESDNRGTPVCCNVKPAERWQWANSISSRWTGAVAYPACQAAFLSVYSNNFAPFNRTLVISNWVVYPFGYVLDTECAGYMTFLDKVNSHGAEAANSYNQRTERCGFHARRNWERPIESADTSAWADETPTYTNIMELKNKNRQSNVAMIRFNYDNDTQSVQHFDHLFTQSSMHSFFNINDFISSSTVPDPDENSNIVDSSAAASSILIVIKCFVIGFIILAAIFGNMLVIVSVMQHRKLR